MDESVSSHIIVFYPKKNYDRWIKKKKLHWPPFKFYVITLTSKIINIYILHWPFLDDWKKTSKTFIYLFIFKLLKNPEFPIRGDVDVD